MLQALVMCLPALVYLLWRRRSADARATMGLTLPPANGWLLGLLAAAVSLGLGWAATRGIPAEVFTGDNVTGRITGVVAAVVVIAKAVGEELLFRGFVQGLVARRFGASWGIAVQAVLFLLPHLALLAVSPTLAPLVATQAVVGVILGWLRHHTGSVAPGCLAHAATNVLVGLLV